MNRTEFSISPTDINMRKEPKESVFFRHPFLVSALICLLCAVLTFGSQYYISAQSVILISVSFCCALSLIFSRTQFGKTADPRYRALIYTAFIALSALTGVLLAESEHKAVFILGLGLIVCLIVFIYLFVMQRLTVQRIVLLLFAVGFLLRLTYVLYTSCMERQHDVTTIGSGEGHLGYIEYLYQNASLPDFDVRTVWQFYHPPLHHFFSALWMKLLTAFGAGYEQACESIQILTLFYSSCCMIISYKIFKSFYLRGAGLVVACAVVAFHPTFIIFAGEINNDILSVTFMLGAILNTVNWYRRRTVKNILKIALCVGLGMMTKLSVWMVAPAIGVVFAVVFFTRLKQWKKYLGQFAAFLGVCAPLGLWWSVRNYILWGVSPSYVPMLSETNEQYVGNYSVTQRLFDFSLSQLKWVYTQFACYEGSYYEYNPTIALFKTAMFDERINDVIYPAIAISGVILFWSGVILAIIGFAAMIGFLIKKNGRISFATKIFLLLIYVVILGSYYIFCFTYQFTCTQNIRYIIPLITLGALFVGTVPSMISGKQKYKKALRGSLYGLTALFCIYSAVTYSVIGLY